MGFLGLNTWRQQLREGQQVEHAENALAAAGQMFSAIAAARSPLSQMSKEEFDDRPRRLQVRARITVDRMNQAWADWRNFQHHYALVRLFADPAKEQLDVVRAVADYIFGLQYHAETMWENANPGDTTAHAELIKAREAFYGRSSDPFGKRLAEADDALKAELRPILRLAPGWWKKHWCATRQWIALIPFGLLWPG